jgi:hypothetical protein
MLSVLAGLSLWDLSQPKLRLLFGPSNYVQYAVGVFTADHVGNGSLFVTQNVWNNKHDYNEHCYWCIQPLDGHLQSRRLSWLVLQQQSLGSLRISIRNSVRTQNTDLREAHIECSPLTTPCILPP